MVEKYSNTLEKDTSIPEAGRKHDLFQDPALTRSLEEDPVARFVVAHWKNIFVVLLALAGLFYLRTRIQATSDLRIEESSETFDKARSSLMELVELKQKFAKEQQAVAEGKDKSANAVASPSAEDLAKGEKLARAARDSLSALKSGPEPYALLAPFYEELLGKVENQQIQPSTSVLSWENETLAGNRLILEMQELSLARLLIDSEATFKDGSLKLRRLAEKGLFVKAPAILSLLRVTEDASSAQEIIALAQEIIKLYPEQAGKIEQEIKRLS